MWNPPTKKMLEKVPALYATESVPLADKKIHMHFFIGGCDWWVAEYDKDEELFFGYACLGDPAMAEWGYISLAELKGVKVGFVEVDRDRYWKVKTAKDVEGITIH